ncbi:MAG TPA: response regulator, partial [Bryobacteraceae bacterium]|nr:response regulator [Bryobacteraceae bacterium]
MNVRVLVVDDSAAFGRVMKQALESIPGVEVAGVCRTGARALDQMRAEPPDLVTLDIEMPNMNGLDVLQTMRREQLKVAAIMVSAASDHARDLTMRALQLGALDFIPKPQGEGAEENLEALRQSLAPLLG